MKDEEEEKLQHEKFDDINKKEIFSREIRNRLITAPFVVVFVCDSAEEDFRVSLPALSSSGSMMFLSVFAAMLRALPT